MIDSVGIRPHSFRAALLVAATMTLATQVYSQVSASYSVRLPGSTAGYFQDFLDEVEAADSADRTAIIDSFMSAVSFPHIAGDTAIFIHRGAFSSVSVPGDMNGWDQNAFSMQKLADTDFWFYRQTFEPTARLDYKFVTNGSDWILDPRNPNQVSGGFGPNSELAMPEYVQPDEIHYRPDLPHGTVTDSVVTSTALGNSRRVQIYLPPGYNPAGSYAMMLFHDGTDYLNLSSVINVLDNLIGTEQIDPVIAVFVPPVDRNNEYAFSRTDDYESFVVDELMPWLMEDFPISDDPALRGTTGVSFSGLISTQLCYRHPDVFGLCGPVSPAYWPNNNAVMNEVLNGEQKDIRFYIDWGTYETGIAADGRVMRDGLIAKGYDAVWNEWFEGHSWGNWRAHLDNLLISFYPFTTANRTDDGVGHSEFKLFPSYPNPFDDSTRIEFELPAAGEVIVEMFDVAGRTVFRSPGKLYPSGRHTVELSAVNLASGVYIIELFVDGSAQASRAVIRR